MQKDFYSFIPPLHSGVPKSPRKGLNPSLKGFQLIKPTQDILFFE